MAGPPLGTIPDCAGAQTDAAENIAETAPADAAMRSDLTR